VCGSLTYCWNADVTWLLKVNDSCLVFQIIEMVFLSLIVLFGLQFLFWLNE
jgi:hypothetical protein